MSITKDQPVDLVAAAQAVLDRWDSPQWKWHTYGPTADLMHSLRAALAQPAAPTPEVHQPVLFEDYGFPLEKSEWPEILLKTSEMEPISTGQGTHCCDETFIIDGCTVSIVYDYTNQAEPIEIRRYKVERWGGSIVTNIQAMQQALDALPECGIKAGESIEQAAEGWAQWCEAQGNRMLANFLRETIAQTDSPPMHPKPPKFSDFIRNASIQEKENVYLKVMDAACERQKNLLATTPPSAAERPHCIDCGRK